MAKLRNDALAELITSLDAELRGILEKILEAEQAKLHMKNPRNIQTDIENIIRQEVKH